MAATVEEDEARPVPATVEEDEARPGPSLEERDGPRPLTDQEKRENHTKSEQKRRAQIRLGFERLTTIIPGLEIEQARQEAVVLQNTLAYAKHLLLQRKVLIEQLEEKGESVDPEMKKVLSTLPPGWLEANDLLAVPPSSLEADSGDGAACPIESESPEQSSGSGGRGRGSRTGAKRRSPDAAR